MRRLHVAAALVLLVTATLLYLWRVPTDPPGFYIDESSICYNAHKIAQTGQDEYGVSWPLYFHAFGEYKNPTLIYLLALFFKVTGPSIAVARLCTASLGLLTGVFLGLLAWRMTQRSMIAGAVAVAAWLTPWLFESSRVVLEVTVYPCLVALFLLATWSASRKTNWSWREIVALATMLALLTYSSSIGRLLGPLLALGLALLIRATNWRGLLGVWVSYAAFLFPLLIFHNRHPGALTGRFAQLTYFTPERSLWDSLSQFIQRYGADLNPWHWLVNGGTDVRDHVPGTGSMLAAVVLLGLSGLCLILRHRWRDPWWRFVLYGLLVAVVPGALTRNEFSQLRLIAFPVFFLVLTIPALVWLLAETRRIHARPEPKRLIFAVVVTLMVSQGLYFQWLYHRRAPEWWYVFDARFPRKVLAPALATDSNPIYLFDALYKSGYIQALWHGVLAGVGTDRLVRLEPGRAVPPGGVAISTEEVCQNCRLIARSLNYIVYAVPPFTNVPTEPKRALDNFRASIVARNVPRTFSPGQPGVIDLLVINISGNEWPCVGEPDGRYAVQVRARWRPESGSISEEGNFAKNLPYDMEPGDTVGLHLEITAPATPGEHVLEIDLFQEGVGWFAEHGSESVRVNAQIIPN